MGGNSDICVKKYESIDTNTGSVAREQGFSLTESSRAYVDTLKVSGDRCYSNTVYITAASSACIANITINGNSGHNGVLITSASSAYIANITISGRSGHQHLLVDASRLTNYASCNFTGATAGNNQKLAIVRGGLATVVGNGYSRGVGNDANQAVNIWSAHGSWHFSGNRT